jgi:hypothetical protein
MSAGIVQLLKISLASETVYLSDGGFIEFSGDLYTSYSETLGSISSIDPFEAGFGGSISSVDIEFANPDFNAVAALSEAALRNRAIEMYVAEYDPATGLLDGTPTRKFIGQIDQCTTRFGNGVKSVGVSCTSRAEPIFSRNGGNAMSDRFQRLIDATDNGHAQGTGLVKQWAWGTASINGTSGGSGSGGGSGGDFNDAFDPTRINFQ